MSQSVFTDVSGARTPHPQIAAYLDALKFERQLLPYTLEGYTRELTVLQCLGTRHAANVDLTQLQSHHICRMMAQLYGDDLSDRSIAWALSAWRGWFKWMALRDAIVTANPVDDVHAPRSPRRLPRALSVEQAVALMEQLPGDDPETVCNRAVNELSYSCGLRLSELVSLDMRHVKVGTYKSTSWLDPEAREVRVLGKGSKRRTVPVGTKAAKALAAWLAMRAQLARPGAAPGDAHALFLPPRDKRLAQRQIQLRMKRNAIAAGVSADVHPHMLRHFFATHMLQSSGGLRAVQELLGHASIASTQVYTLLGFQHLAKIYDQTYPRARKKQRYPLCRANHPSRMRTLIFKPGKERSLLRRHPWIFASAIDRVEGKPASGATVIVRAHNGQFLARVTFSSVSQIRARVWSFDESEPVDHAFFKRRIAAAVTYRHAWVYDTDAVCLVMDEADGLPGLIVGQYGTDNTGQLVYQFSAAGVEHWKQAIVAALVKETGCPNVYERSDVSVREREGLGQMTGMSAGAEPSADLPATERGVRYYVDVREGHKTGFYVNQRDNRALIDALARDRDMLNCFRYTGGFSLAALKGGTYSVMSIDLPGEALAVAERNITLNGFDPVCAEWLDANVFKSLRNFRVESHQFDLIILDPPKFAASAQQVNRAARACKEINPAGMQLLRPGGLLFTYSCSGAIDADLFQKIVANAAADAKVTAHIQCRLAGGVDHPLLTSFPEGEYLKGLLLQVSQ